MIVTSILIIVSATIATVITRLSPLWIPIRIQNGITFKYLAQVLPLASFGLLVVYSLRTVNEIELPYILIQMISIIVIVVIQYIKENILLSIFIGTFVYMVLLNTSIYWM